MPRPSPPGARRSRPGPGPSAKRARWPTVGSRRYSRGPAGARKTRPRPSETAGPRCGSGVRPVAMRTPLTAEPTASRIAARRSGASPGPGEGGRWRPGLRRRPATRPSARGQGGPHSGRAGPCPLAARTCGGTQPRAPRPHRGQRRMRKPFVGCANPAHRGLPAGQPGPQWAPEELPQGVAPSLPQGGWRRFPRAVSQASRQLRQPCRAACAVRRPQRSA